MGETTASLKKEMEELIDKTIEANRVFMKEGAQLVQQLGRNTKEPFQLGIFQNDFLAGAVKSYASLNIAYLKNMVDLGISLTKQMGGKSADITPAPAKPSFELSAVAVPGDRVALTFLLENFKDSDVTCELINTPYQAQSQPALQSRFSTIFSPQAFLLNKGEAREVLISVDIPEETDPGVYISQVQVKGFEPAFFTIQLTIHSIKS